MHPRTPRRSLHPVPRPQWPALWPPHQTAVDNPSPPPRIEPRSELVCARHLISAAHVLGASRQRHRGPCACRQNLIRAAQCPCRRSGPLKRCATRFASQGSGKAKDQVRPCLSWSLPGSLDGIRTRATALRRQPTGGVFPQARGHLALTLRVSDHSWHATLRTTLISRVPHETHMQRHAAVRHVSTATLPRTSGSSSSRLRCQQPDGSEARGRSGQHLSPMTSRWLV